MIALVSGGNPLEPHGGHHTLVRAHARAARRAGFDVHVFWLGSRDQVRETEIGCLHEVASGLLASGWPAPRISWIPLHARRLRAALLTFALAAREPVILHGFSLWAAVAVQAAAVARGRGRRVPVVASLYTAIEHETAAMAAAATEQTARATRLWYRAHHLRARVVSARLERAILRQADRVWVNYATLEEELRHRHPETANLTRVPYASESVFLARGSEGAGRRSGPPRIVCVSRYDPRKGIDVLLQALARVQESGLQFHASLVGHGKLERSLDRLRRELGLDAQVEITGRVPDSRGYLRHADIFALPSLQEGSGSLSMLEAMQEGCAVVASRVDGIPEDVDDGVHALLVPPGDIAQLARALARVLTDPLLRERLAAAARRRLDERFSAGAMVEAVAKGYAELGVHPNRAPDARD